MVTAVITQGRMGINSNQVIIYGKGEPKNLVLVRKVSPLEPLEARKEQVTAQVV